jgi:hypothetical protein
MLCCILSLVVDVVITNWERAQCVVISRWSRKDFVLRLLIMNLVWTGWSTPAVFSFSTWGCFPCKSCAACAHTSICFSTAYLSVEIIFEIYLFHISIVGLRGCLPCWVILRPRKKIILTLLQKKNWCSSAYMEIHMVNSFNATQNWCCYAYMEIQMVC